jgi:ABC-type branched-subunit amino acid transport system ATPase component
VTAGPLLDVEGVHAGYGEMEILHGVSIRVGAGEIVTLIGPNGAGKSTLMRTIFGLLAPRRGVVRLRGEGIGGLAPEAIVRRGVAYVPQVDNVFPSLTVDENLAMGAVIRRDDPSSRVERVLGLFPGLRPKRRQKVGTLSGGERQMVATGRALMLDPSLLMLDEPSAGLSPIMVEAVFAKIAEINRAGVAVLLVEQSARDALALSHRGYVLAGGQNRLEGPGRALLEDAEVGRLYLGG